MFQRRSDNRDALRQSQASETRYSSKCSKDKHRNKFIKVYSKKDNQTQGIKDNLRDSTASLPIDFDQQRNHTFNGYHSRSQVKLFQTSLQVPTQQIIHQRQQSLPNHMILVRQTIAEPSIKFMYPQFTSPLKVQIEPAYRCSLPLNTRLTKDQIIRAEQIRQASRSVRMFSNFPTPVQSQPARSSLVHYPSQIRACDMKPNYNIVSQPQPQLQYKCLQNNSHNLSIAKQQVMNKEQILQRIRTQPAPEMLSNQLYMECTKTTDTAINTDLIDCLDLQVSQVKVVNPDISRVSCPVASTDCSEKQNIQAKMRSSVCEKIKNFSQCSEIRINTNQVLKPKKNFVFV